jgi:glutamine amidotransferase
MITIVNYGLGNVSAIANIYHRINVPVRLAATSAELSGAQRLILPGVGAFDWAMTKLDQSGMRDRLEQLVLEEGIPVLGICVGMQMLAENSEEGKLAGLGWIPGRVRRFDETRISNPTHLPHMGWNDVVPRRDEDLFRELGVGARFYFLHSYYFAPRNDEHVLSETDYYGVYASSVRRANIYGVQFHPEKSHQWGVKLLENFSKL